jgi:hypothetical protein
VNETLEYLGMFARLPFALRRFSQHRLTLDEAEAIVRERMEHREENFLRIVERCIYGCPASPYRPLLAQARCGLGDLRALVSQKGVEGALRDLRGAGVYVTYEEFKGRKPIIRDGIELKVAARDFDNPFAHHDLMLETGGSTGLANVIGQDLEYAAARAPNRMLSLAVHGALGAPLATWTQILPGSSLRNILQYWHFGQDTDRWFSPSGWRDSKHWLKYGLATLYCLALMRVSGIRAPLPHVVRLDQAAVIARWAGEALRVHGRCQLRMAVSRALRVCLAAEEIGIDLRGTVITIGGEPATPAKVEAMQRTGARCVPSYSSTETGQIGAGCAAPAEIGDMHLFHDAIALITHPYLVEGAGVTVPAFNLTSLVNSTPKIMLNVQIDDYGIVEERACDCALGRYGYTVHLRQVRSYSKLVGEGVTLIGNEMVRILEEVLPARFGGSPLDYQLLEEEDAQGFTRLYLVIHPRVPIADEPSVVDVVLKALSQSSPMAEAARTAWQGAETIRIRRAEPVWTARGKFMPLHVERRSPVS